MRAALEADDRVAAQVARGGRHDPRAIRSRPRQRPRGVDARRGSRRRCPSPSWRRRSPGRCPRRQVRVYPWQRIAGRGRLARTQTRLALAGTLAVLVALVAFGSLGGGFGVAPVPSPSAEPIADPDPILLPIPPDPITVPVPRDPDRAHGQRRGGLAPVSGDRREGPVDADLDRSRGNGSTRRRTRSGRGSRQEGRRISTTTSRSTRTASGSPTGTRRCSTGSTRPPRR